jgi:hypothetical protein
MTSSDDFTKMTDPEFLAERRRVREQLEHTPEFEVSAALTERYELLNEEFLRRADLMGRWQVNATQAIATLPRDAARMLAVEILLADPESLGDDVLEPYLYLLRERLRANAQRPQEFPNSHRNSRTST